MKKSHKTALWALLFSLALALGAAPAALAAYEPADDPTVAAFGATATPARTVIPMGRTVGIKLFSDGVLVVGLSEIPTGDGSCAPAKDCGLKEGDIITHMNRSEVDTIEEVQSLLKKQGGQPMSVRAMRGDKTMQVTIKPAKAADGSYKLGAWIRDSMAGIGTMTFYDPASGLFGALGHGISDVDTGKLMPLQSGGIMHSTVTDVKRGASGAPGELHGAFRVQTDLGSLYANTDSGVFGTLKNSSDFQLGAAIPIAQRREVSLGHATILSNIQGETVAEYDVELTKIFPNSKSDTRDLMIRVTDPRLLEATGGIVQGMSGSPILQNGRLVGAVTHVLVNDPTAGYGILVCDMLERAGTA
ncbi:MAG: SpoIVB peptidase [Oscillospiraceae bacterium]